MNDKVNKKEFLNKVDEFLNRNKELFIWISIGIALLSTVGIFYIPGHRKWFVLVLVLNIVFVVLTEVKGLLAHILYAIHPVLSGLKRMNPLVVCRVLVGCLFIFSSFTKGVDPLGTKYKMLDYFAAYQIEWMNEAAMVLAVLMILAEFLIGICLMTNVCPKVAAIGGGVFMLLFTGVTLFDALFDKVPDCGCFGTAVKMTNWQTFYKNLVIDAVLLPLILNIRKLKGRPKPVVQFAIGMAYALAFTGFELYNYRHLPIIDFLNWKVGRQMNPKEEKKPETYVTYRNKVTGEEKEYLSPNFPWNDSVWMSQWEFVESRMVGEVYFLGFSALNENYVDVTKEVLNTENLLMFTSYDMDKITDKEWEKIEKVTETANQKGYKVCWVTASSSSKVNEMKTKHPFVDHVYFGDDREIKTVVRYNPGLIWLDNGLVKGKWSAVDFNKAWARI